MGRVLEGKRERHKEDVAKNIFYRGNFDEVLKSDRL